MRKVKKDFLVDEVTDDPEREVYAKENITLCVPPRGRWKLTTQLTV